MQLSRLLGTIILMYFFFHASMFLAAENQQWKWIGPETGKNLNLVPDPQHSNIWYCINDGKLLRSSNSAQSWNKINFVPTSFSVHPISSDIIATKVESERTTFYSSVDYGKTFTQLSAVPFRAGFVQSSVQEKQLASVGQIYSSGDFRDIV